MNIDNYETYLIKARNDLNALAEKSWCEKFTKAYIVSSAKNFCCKVIFVNEGIVLYFDFAQKDSLIFRAEMDGLPFVDKCRHACGHDGNMAICLGLAKYLSDKKTANQKIGYNIAIVFQPAEEDVGGAKSLLKEDTLKSLNPKYCFALHLMPKLKFGKMFSLAGDFLAGSTEVNIQFLGKQTHIAKIEEGADSLQTACDFLSVAQKRIKQSGGLLRFGKIEGNFFARNIVCDKIILQGSLRFFGQEKGKKIKKIICNVADIFALKHGCKAVYDFSEGLPSLFNSKKLFDKAQKCSDILPVKKMWICDDFSLYATLCPILYCLLGVGDTPPLHSENFDFRPTVLKFGLSHFVNLLQI